MPHITVSMYPGRDDELKSEIAKKLKETMIEEFDFPAETLSVSIEDIAQEKFDNTIQSRIAGENKLFESSQHVKE